VSFYSSLKFVGHNFWFKLFNKFYPKQLHSATEGRCAQFFCDIHWGATW